MFWCDDEDYDLALRQWNAKLRRDSTRFHEESYRENDTLYVIAMERIHNEWRKEKHERNARLVQNHLPKDDANGQE